MTNQNILESLQKQYESFSLDQLKSTVLSKKRQYEIRLVEKLQFDIKVKEKAIEDLKIELDFLNSLLIEKMNEDEESDYQWRKDAQEKYPGIFDDEDDEEVAEDPYTESLKKGFVEIVGEGDIF
jgi:hypothetical protein